MPSSSNYRPDIDGLRAVAVLAVVLFHAGVTSLSGGFVGVDVFFVISGFLITRILYREISEGRFSIIKFYERRARRILPALFAMLAVTLATGWAILSPEQLVGLTRSAFAAVLSFSNIWFWRLPGGYFADAGELRPLLHTWSLAVEEQFYLFFPLLLMAVLRWRRTAAAPVVAALSLASLALSIVGVAAWQQATFYNLPTRAWELGVGGLLALGVEPRLRSRPLREAVAAAGLGAIVFSMFAYDELTAFPGLTAAPPCLGAAAIIAAGGSGATWVGRLLSFRPVVFVGLVSYSFYLWHWPVLAFARHLYSSIYLPAAAGALCVVLSFLLAVLSWRYVEQPFRAPQRAGGFSRGAVFAYSGAGVACVVAAAFAVDTHHGFPSRWNDTALRAFAGAEDENPDRGRCFNINAKDDWCRFGGPGAQETTPADFLLWGDSHADAIMPALADLAGRAGKVGVFAGRQACAPLLGITQVEWVRGGKTVCPDLNDAVISRLRARDDIPLVVLAARWAHHAEGEIVPGAGGQEAILTPVGAPLPDRPSTAGNYALFKDSLARTVKAIRDTGREVLILGQAPEVNWSVPERLARQIEWGRSLPAGPLRTEMERRQGRAVRFLEALSEQPGVTYLPVSRYFCDETCRVQIDGAPLYVDGNHLSQFGALSLTPALAEQLWTEH